MTETLSMSVCGRSRDQRGPVKVDLIYEDEGDLAVIWCPNCSTRTTRPTTYFSNMKAVRCPKCLILQKISTK